MSRLKSSRFVRLDPGFYRHRKTLRLRRCIGDAALWIPPRLWADCIQRGTGDLSEYTAEDLAAVLDYPGDAGALKSSLMAAGFISSDGNSMAGWQEYYGDSFDFYAKRAKKANDARWGKTSSLDPSSEDQEEKRIDREREGASKKDASSIPEASPSPPDLWPLVLPESEIPRITAAVKCPRITEAYADFTRIKRRFKDTPEIGPVEDFIVWLQTAAVAKKYRAAGSGRGFAGQPDYAGITDRDGNGSSIERKQAPGPEGWQAFMDEMGWPEAEYKGKQWGEVRSELRTQVSREIAIKKQKAEAAEGIAS